jgi:DnaK suppressor protein
MEEFRAKLLQEKTEIESDLKQLPKALQERGDYGFGKGDPAVYEWEFNLAMFERQKQRLAEVEKALQRIEQDVYNLCEMCGQPIETERLEALPFTSLCIHCARSKR